eukprot:TRINITY_DN3345_c0_g1_i4.p1 TRINITY_DN3345_c0_g1~~TRINITY_DN3345_c0_g1_i4.p1  ORF type:complete len:108 (+),score=24.70 TRINITY_DN3345_c0_g1_i4:48-371(+)
MKLILGSSSSFRRELAKRHFTCSVETTSPDIDEKAIRRDDPSELVTAIAIAKADALIPRLGKQDAFLITSDQVLYNPMGETTESFKNSIIQMETPQDGLYALDGLFG